MQRIAHLDMDAFFASVELLRFPQLKDHPVVIGGSKSTNNQDLFAEFSGRLEAIPLQRFMRLKDYAGRGVITTATYPARAFGIGSAMGLMKAAKLCPDAILLPANFDDYKRYSNQFKQAVAQITPTIEDRGIDEIYIDLSAHLQDDNDMGWDLALRLQQAVQQSTGLSCSIGVAPNKLLAKMASEMDKPKGITLLLATDLQSKIWPLPVRKIHGVGPKSEAKLHAIGLRCIGDIAASDPTYLQLQFGQSYGQWLFNASHGRDERVVQTHSDPVSFSRETTFSKDLHPASDKDELSTIFNALCQDLASKLQARGLQTACVGIKIRYANFQTITRDLALATPSNQADVIRTQARQCLKKVNFQQRFRLLGVKVSKLSNLDTDSDLKKRAMKPHNLALFSDSL